MRSCAVVMLSKSPAIDRCKTRLTNELSQPQANDLQSAIIYDIFASITPERDYDLWVAAPSPESLVFFQILASRFLIQEGHDLGEKMEKLSSNLFAKGYQHVILIGSDMPLMTSDLLTEAMRLLETCDCVIGPAKDGGYYLMGMGHPMPDVFSGIEWSTNKVFRQTVEAFESASLHYGQLPVHRDMDDWDDLQYYRSAGLAIRIPNTSRWLNQHC